VLVRRTAATLLAVSLLVLAGCSGGSSDDPTSSPSASTASGETTPSAEDVAALEAVTITGDLGAVPTFDFEQPFTVSAPVARVADPGTGDTIAADQLVTMHVAAVSGEDGSSVGTTYGSTPQAYVVDDSTLPQVMLDTLIGAQVGVRILYATPGSTTNDPSQIWSLEVTSAQDVPARAEGTAVTPAEGLPTVTLADDGTPSITPLSTDAPTTLVVQPLIQGAGATVSADQTVVVNYTGWLWDGTQFDSSWESGAPMATPLANLITGWQQGLAGQTVGSQVLLIVPPDLGYGANDNGSIPANSTLIFVVDILAAA
jgi:peptidylprolyl isomerase